MRKAAYPEISAHLARHEAILAQIDGWSGRIECGEADSIAAFCDFLKDWILRHILSVDRAYAGKLG